MRRLVLDACVAIKWFVKEEYSEAALNLVASAPEWVVPDLFFCEVGNVLWKKVCREEMAEADVRETLASLLSLEMKIREARPLVLPALEIAASFRCTVYDGLYLAAALDEDCPLVTADGKFYRNFSKTPLADHLLWIEKAL